MKPEYYIGIDMIDEEHKQLFKYADEAYELLHLCMEYGRSRKLTAPASSSSSRLYCSMEPFRTYLQIPRRRSPKSSPRCEDHSLCECISVCRA